MEQALHEPFLIGVGDIHQHIERLAEIPDIARALAVILSGDLTNHGGEKEASRILQTARRSNPQVLAQLGNMDLPAVTGFLKREGVNLHREARALGGAYLDYGIMGVGASTFTPFSTPSEVSDEEMGRWLEGTYELAKGFKHLLVVIHNPPKDSMADAVGVGVHVGSPAVRRFLERAQPDVCLTGHIHESACEDRIGRTQVINPGTLEGGGYARISVTPDGFRARLERISRR